MTQAALDLSKIHETFNRGDITVHVTWIYVGSNRSTPQPCLVLIRNNASIDQRQFIHPYVVVLDNAYMWVPETWTDEAAVLRNAQQCADVLGFNPNSRKILFTIMSVINDHISDLFNCPPAPPRETRVVAEAMVRDRNTGAVAEGEIRN